MLSADQLVAKVKRTTSPVAAMPEIRIAPALVMVARSWPVRCGALGTAAEMVA